ncbi:MAG: DUF4783 domain-containing protein [Bacteroidota bacterium]
MKTTFVVLIAIFLACPVVLISQDSQPKRPREPARTQQPAGRPPQSQPKKRPAARPAEPRKKEGKKPTSTVPQQRRVPREREKVRDQERQRPKPSQRPAEPRKKEVGKPASTVPRQRPVPPKTDEVRDQERQRLKPSERPRRPRSERDQPSPRTIPRDRPSPRQPAEKYRPTEQELVPSGRDLRTILRPEHRKIFESTESAISRASIRSMTAHLAPKVYIRISGGESGYFSANQAQYVLENYFGSHRPVGFSFSTFGESFSNPYATGRGSFVYRGSRHDAQIYVSLTRQGGRWVISQVNIY